ncbi:MAG: peptidase M61, partial [Burkholderiaceae bacterium]
MEAIHYTIHPSDPHAHLFEIAVRIDRPDPRGQEVYLPVWIPGSYMIREFARHLEAVVAEVGGSPHPIVKLSKARWRCAPLPESARSITIRYRAYAWDLSVRCAHLDSDHGFFNGTSVFVAVDGREREPVSVDISRPPGTEFRDWRLATTLPREPGTRSAGDWSFGRFRAGDYDELVDHPAQMGRFAVAGFDVGGCRHEIVVSAAPGSDLDRVARDLKPVCARQIALFEPSRRRAPMRRYLFLVMATPDGYGGLEHRSSTALICGRDDLPYPGMVAPTDGYRTFLGLASHEYFHTWNVKRIKPAVFDPYEWLQETHTDLLWIFEGFTSYYDDLMLRRAGLIDDKGYLTLVERAINRVAAGPGRLVQSAAESSFDAWTKYYRQDENSANSIVSYYLKGSLVALCLDLTIRARTRSRRSLDDVMRSMWQRWGRDFYSARETTGHGLAEDGFADVVSEATGLDLRAEIAAWAYGTDELPLVATLRPFGVRLEPAHDSGGAVIGARVTARDGGLVIASADRNGAAALAGLSAGDLIVAIDGLRCTDQRLKTALA